MRKEVAVELSFESSGSSRRCSQMREEGAVGKGSSLTDGKMLDMYMKQFTLLKVIT